MSRVPPAAWLLGVVGLVPFLGGAFLTVAPVEDAAVSSAFGVMPPSRTGGAFILEGFGVAILGFMGGCLWGFASMRPAGPGLGFLVLSAAPALIAFASIRETPALSCIWLAFGFAALQGIDVLFQRAGVAPDYWLTLRLPLTAVVIACLLVGALYG